MEMYIANKQIDPNATIDELMKLEKDIKHFLEQISTIEDEFIKKDNTGEIVSYDDAFFRHKEDVCGFIDRDKRFLRRKLYEITQKKIQELKKESNTDRGD